MVLLNVFVCLFVDRVLLCSSAGLQVMIPLGQLPGCCSDRPVSSLCFLRRASMPGVSGLMPFAMPCCSRKLLTRCLPDSDVIGLEFSASRTESQTISVLYVSLSLGYLAIAAKKNRPAYPGHSRPFQEHPPEIQMALNSPKVVPYQPEGFPAVKSTDLGPITCTPSPGHLQHPISVKTCNSELRGPGQMWLSPLPAVGTPL